MRCISVTMALAAVLLLGSAPVAAQSELKIGVFDSQRVSEETAEGQRLASELSALRDRKQQEITTMEQELQGLQDRLQQQALSLSPDKRAALETDIQRRPLTLSNARDLATRELQLEINAAENGFNDKLRGVIKQFGRDNGFTLVFETAQVGWFAATIDVTALIIDQFDRMYPAKTE